MLFLAFRNIFRNKRRTFMTVLILGVSFTLLMLINSYVTTMYDILKKGSIEQTGHVQIQARDTGKDNPLIGVSDILMIEKSLAGNSKVYDIAKELDVSGLVGTDMRSTIFNAVGVEYAKKGAASSLTLVSGFNLTREDYDKESLLLSSEIAQKINVKEGHYVVLVVTNSDGVLNLSNGYINGLVSTGQTDRDLYFVSLPLKFAQTLLGTEGVSRMMIYLDDEKSIDSIIVQLKGLIEENNLNLIVKDWKELASYYFGLKNLYDFIFAFVFVIICVLVALSVSEIISIGLFERFREIGTMRAIGTKKNEVFVLLLLETLLYNISGIAFGVIFALIISSGTNMARITFVPPGQNAAVPFMFNLNITHTFLPVGLLLFVSFLSTIFPIIKTTKMRIVEVIRHV